MTGGVTDMERHGTPRHARNTGDGCGCFQPNTPPSGIPYVDPAGDASIADPAQGIMPPSCPTPAVDLLQALDAFAR